MVARVLVTGAAGYVGRTVCKTAVRQGLDVTAMVRASELEFARRDSGRVVVADWDDLQSVGKCLRDASADVIIHCVGLPGTQGHSAAELYEANVAPVWRLLDAATTVGTRPRIVLVSSAAVYGAQGLAPIREDQEPEPSDHYGWSKLAAEHIGSAFCSSSGLDVMVARPFNITGLDERDGSVVTRVVGQLRGAGSGERATVRVWEDSSVRDYVDVRDVAIALLLIGVSGEVGKAYNVCTGHGTSVRDVIGLACDVIGCSPEVIVERPEMAGTTSIGDPSALTGLGWAPAWSLRDSLLSTMRGDAAVPASLIHQRDSGGGR